MPPKGAVIRARPLPRWLPDPDEVDFVVDIQQVVAQMEATAHKHVGRHFAASPPLAIGSLGWSAPFDEGAAVTALRTTGAYQCAMNV